MGLDRSISDHCPLLIECGSKNWGSGPFRNLDVWFSKLKRLKEPIRKWNKQVFGNLDAGKCNLRRIKKVGHLGWEIGSQWNRGGQMHRIKIPVVVLASAQRAIQVASASIPILVNGSPTAPFKTKWGLRQGDPLPPFLFVLAVEMFNVLMQRAVGLSIVEGLKVGARCLCIPSTICTRYHVLFSSQDKVAAQIEKDHGLLLIVISTTPN